MELKRTDWPKLKLDYVHGVMTMRDLADANNIKSAGVMRRAANEGWDAARKQVSAEVSKIAGASLTFDKVTELSKFNDDDLKIAKKIKSEAVKMLLNADNPQDLKTLSAVFDTAQKIGRLALGAATENTNVTQRTLEPLQDIDFLG